MRIIIPSVLLSALLSITGVQGQGIIAPTCAATFDATSLLEEGTIYDLLCGTVVPVPATDPAIADTRAQFTTFCNLLDQFDTYPAILSNKDSGAEYTVFAPANAAFAGIDILETLAADDVIRILDLHIVKGRKQTSDLECSQQICAINTNELDNGKNNLPQDCVQTSKTKCTTAGTSFQIGPDNNGLENWPKIGSPINLFNQVPGFPSNLGNDVLSNAEDYFSSNVNVCNGVVHVVDNYLRPEEDYECECGSKNGKSAKAGRKL